MLLYALHADSDLDTETIHRSLKANPALERKAMSVAEKLKAEGLTQGRQEGLWIGRIQSLEEFLSKPQTPSATLEALGIEELQTIHQQLHREYEARFKGR